MFADVIKIYKNISSREGHTALQSVQLAFAIWDWFQGQSSSLRIILQQKTDRVVHGHSKSSRTNVVEHLLLAYKS